MGWLTEGYSHHESWDYLSLVFRKGLLHYFLDSQSLVKARLKDFMERAWTVGQSTFERFYGKSMETSKASQKPKLQVESTKQSKMKDYVFFWRKGSCFSQWHPCEYELNGYKYSTAEQGMMHGKALLFKDKETAAQILATNDPRKIKQLGRLVRGFKENAWNNSREIIVYQNNMAKFTQNEALKEALMATKGALLVEASPADTIWGIGLREADARKRSPQEWKGLNLLGKILTKVREDIAAMEETLGEHLETGEEKEEAQDPTTRKKYGYCDDPMPAIAKKPTKHGRGKKAIRR